jgi:uncharacterized membrane protein YgcG
MTSPAGVVDGLLADRYRLTARLGAGGMGEVWRADDLVLGRVVAVKTLVQGHAEDDEHRARFRAEARAAARLSHPGIATVYDFGELPDRAWIVMELVEGEPLSRVLQREGRMHADRTLDIVGQVAAALSVAHAAGVVHRDVKPGNLLLRRDGVVKVTDFGIASTADADPLTRTGHLVGTAGYLSPEQAGGGAGSAQTDLYALGVLAYECLSGARPFAAENPVAELLGHLQTPPPDLPEDVPAPVRALVLRLLAKDPAERPPSATALLAEVRETRRVLGGSPPQPATRPLPRPVPSSTVARPFRTAGTSPGATSRQVQRWAVTLTALLLGLLAVVLGLRGADTEELTRVPAIAVGTPEAEAAAALRSADLRPVTEQRTDDLPTGQVVEVLPAAGTELEPGEGVLLVVSTGPAPPPAAPVEDAPSPPQAESTTKGEATAPADDPQPPAAEAPSEADAPASEAPQPPPADSPAVTDDGPGNSDGNSGRNGGGGRNGNSGGTGGGGGGKGKGAGA